jgi:predicted aldo/keto reductase-like oxidoreductase
MLYRNVPKNSDKLSILGYGCMRFPTRLGRINERVAERQMMHAFDKGVNYYDTAYPYHNGKSEAFVGKVFKKNTCRDKIKLATKLPHWMARSKSDMDRILDEQLLKLQTDRIDYYLVHALNGDNWEIAKTNGVIEFLDTALRQGKILNAGFSFHGLNQEFVPIVDDYDWTFCQIQYNYLDTQNQAGTAGLKYAAANDMAVIIMEPLRGGNLAKNPPPSVKKIWQQSDISQTPAAWALSWIWNHPEVTVVLSGMNDDQHIEENIHLAQRVKPLSMTPSALATVEAAAKEFRRVMKVGCTGCQYCMPCPAGVNIPGCFDAYNSKHAFKGRSAGLMYLFFNGGVTTDKASMASQCVECGECLENALSRLRFQTC